MAKPTKPIIVVVSLVLAIALFETIARLDRRQNQRPPQRNGLKVISFNAQFLPGPGRLFNKRPDAEYRARCIGEKLAAYDVIGLNEVFDAGPRTILLGELRHGMGEDFHCVASPDSERSAFGIDSGLLLVTRFPLLDSHSLKYGNDSSVWKNGPPADGFAAKGVLHARVACGSGHENLLDVFITHLESYDSAIREDQYELLADFIHRYSDPHRPALILGDFNTDGRAPVIADETAQYHRLVAALRRSRPTAHLTDVWAKLSSEVGGTNDQDTLDGGKRIDYVFVSNPMTGKPRLVPTRVSVNRFLDSKVTSLSDHSAVEADLQWQR